MLEPVAESTIRTGSVALTLIPKESLARLLAHHCERFTLQQEVWSSFDRGGYLVSAGSALARGSFACG
jgi:hypothetical protein